MQKRSLNRVGCSKRNGTSNTRGSVVTVLLSLLCAVGCAPAAQNTNTLNTHTTETAAVEAGVKKLPDDGDLVAEADDQCPCMAEDNDQFMDNDGCPDPDNDRDGIPDECDMCPLEPETQNGTEDSDGCPESRVSILAARIQIIENVYFPRNGSTVSPQAIPLIDAVAAVMKEHPDFTHIGILGRASNNERNPDQLSNLRAQHVAAILTQRGIDPARVVAHGVGTRQPLTNGTTEADQMRNRMVAFVLMEVAGTTVFTWNGQQFVPAETSLPPQVNAPRPAPMQCAPPLVWKVVRDGQCVADPNGGTETPNAGDAGAAQVP